MVRQLTATANKFWQNVRQEHFIHIPTSTKSTILLSSMGRSGSTWIASIINSGNQFREIFEPFLPVRVPEANAFEYCQYIRPIENNPAVARAAGKILEGRLKKQPWLDSGNKRLFSTRRLIKDIRTNLMLGWMNRVFPEMKIVLLVRNPFSVVQSYLNLGWGIEPCGSRREIDILFGQEQLLKDYPEIKENFQKFDLKDPFEANLMQWCVLNYVPLKQLPMCSFYVVFYERMLLDPESEIEGLFSYLDLPVNNEVFYSLKKPSRTSYSRREFRIDDIHLNSKQIEKGKEILRSFRLDELYDDNLRPAVR